MSKVHSERVLNQILKVIASGSVALAVTSGCSESASYSEEGASDASNGVDASSNTSAQGDASTTEDTGTTQQLPAVASDMFGCVGEGDMFVGPCCTSAAYLEPEDGSVCPDGATLSTNDLRAGLGSGECACGNGPVGPFDPGTCREARPDDPGEGACCYVISTQGCTGRPLTCSDGEIRVATVVERSDWA